MIAKSELKRITSLNQKKYRMQEGIFVVEGIKSVQEFMSSHFELVHLYATDSFETKVVTDKITRITQDELKKISQLVNPNGVLALFKIPNHNKIEEKGLVVALDQIQDPGNLGTIIRLCDWFGVQQIVCSTDTVDCYNPKVVQATMGSLSRVNVVYTDLNLFLQNTKLPVFLTLLEGKNVYKTTLPPEGILVMGNEANGIRPDIIQNNFIALHIPRMGASNITESLNVATATAIFLSEFRRCQM